MSVAPDEHPLQPAETVIATTGRWWRLRGLHPEQKSWLRRAFTIRNARRTQQIRYTGRPDRDEPETLEAFLETEQGDVLIAPGIAVQVVSALRNGGARVVVIDERPEAPKLQYTASRRAYQDDFVRKMLSEPFGVGVGPCGSGKTNTAADIMCARGGKWTIVVRQTDLVRQWADRLTSVTNGSVTIYKPQNRKKWDRSADFLIGTAQAFIKHPDHCYQIDAEREGVCVDECDEVPANEMISLMQLFAPKWRVGFTATPDRSDGLTPLMYWWIGPKLAQIDREVVEGEGHLMRPRLEVLRTAWGGYTEVCLDGGAAAVNKAKRKNEALVDEALHDDVGRADLIADRVLELWRAGRSILVPVDSISYGYWLRGLIRSKGAHAEFAHAKPGKLRVAGIEKDLRGKAPHAVDEMKATSKKSRIAILDRVAKGETRVLIATSLADRGLDLPILDAVVLATPGGTARRIEQQVGRACRPHPGKPQPLAVYVLDSGVSRVETVTSSETGEVARTVKRPFVSRFRRNYYNVFRKIADVDEVAVRSILKGERRDPQQETEPVRAA